MGGGWLQFSSIVPELLTLSLTCDQCAKGGVWLPLVALSDHPWHGRGLKWRAESCVKNDRWMEHRNVAGVVSLSRLFAVRNNPDPEMLGIVLQVLVQWSYDWLGLGLGEMNVHDVVIITVSNEHSGPQMQIECHATPSTADLTVYVRIGFHKFISNLMKGMFF